MYMYNERVVDLEDPKASLPKGWHFVLEGNHYTGWGNPVRFAVIEPDDDAPLSVKIRHILMQTDDRIGPKLVK